ncbi:hypothetical protein NEOLEDRAFT_36683 [Neolentinus lepideus HHB14362 ss-1]|uniref:CASTOR ACT domain-containing protein n=1 Tax=Neolentinus lepideus HHB14362 ss-1 TaxID=1314782 RepID=A0A165W7Q6_9AGAM|nr:hypothetical protein NEOLEDRAFT_36683 [Neolentinus lepideus HHB14362 ss-1]
MPPPASLAAFHLTVLPQTFYVIQLNPEEKIPDNLIDQIRSSSEHPLFSITRTPEEISIVGEYESDSQSQEKYATWRCIKIAGPMDFGVTGVMCNFTTPLKAAEVPVFAVSTWNTDYVLVPNDKLELAQKALQDDGWVFVGQ